jgi:urease accessory protein
MGKGPENVVYPSWITACHQLFDSALPTGAYAHSCGLEGLVQSGDVVDAATLEEILDNDLRLSLTQVDLPLFRMAYEALEGNCLSKVMDLDRLASATKASVELRRASWMTGRQTWKLYGQILKRMPAQAALYQRCGSYFADHNAVIVSSVLAHILRIPLSAASCAYGRQVLVNFIQCSLKLLGMGPTRVQELIHFYGLKVSDWVEASLSIGWDELGTTSPRWDIASSQHAYAGARLYIS